MSQWQSIEEGLPGPEDRAALDALRRIRATAARLDLNFARRLLAMREHLAAWPPGTRSEPERSPGIVWCWAHHRNLRECIRTGLACKGDLLAARSNPTGERATQPDTVALDRETVTKHLRAAERALDALEAVCATYVPREAAGNVLGRAGVEPGCESCHRIKHWAEVAKPRTTAKGNLAREMRLCSWCYRWTLDVGRLPNRKELEAHRDGRKVYRTV